MLSSTDIQGVYAMLPTPSTPQANLWDATNTVDIDETVRMTNKLIADGVAGLVVLGTTGECATVTDEEYRTFVKAFLETVDGRVPTFVGATCTGTHQTLERLRFAREAGANGTLLGLPMWQACTEEMAVSFYKSISEALPDLAVMVYANETAFRFAFPPSFWAGVAAHAPTAVAAKFMKPHEYLDSLAACGNKINLMPMTEMSKHFAELSPDTVTAVWATSASMGPAPALALQDALNKRDAELIKTIAADIAWANEPVMRNGGVLSEFVHYNIQFEKLRFEASGYLNPGPVRPPYDFFPEHFAEDARENGRRWATLVAQYSSSSLGQ